MSDKLQNNKLQNKLKNALEWIIPILHKHNVPFQVTGGLAGHVYGAKRPINDIDLDVPEDKMNVLLPDIEQYIIFGPANFRDERWDARLITLNYHDQEIDICGAFETKIFNDKTQTWVHYPTDFSKSVPHTLFGITFPVIPPEELIEYKKLLSGDHQKIDIDAAREYIG